MCRVDVVVEDVVVCVASAAAIESCPAFAAVFLAVNMSLGKLIFDVHVKCLVHEVAHFVLVYADKLVAVLDGLEETK